MDKLNEVNQQITDLHVELTRLFDDPTHKSTLLSRKSISQLANKIYTLVENINNPKQGEESKNILLRMFQSHATNFINNKIIFDLIKCHQDQDFINVLCFRWQNYKKILFQYFTLFLHSKDYYEMAYVADKSKNKNPNNITDMTVLPVPALGVILYAKLILNRFKQRIRRVVLMLIKQEREKQSSSNDNLRIILEIVWSCSLQNLARIKFVEKQITFFKEQRKNIVSHFKQLQTSEDYIQNYILNEIVHSTSTHYYYLYQNSLRHLHSLQQIQHIYSCFQRQQSLAEYHMPTKNAISIYTHAIYNQLILADFDNIINKSNGFMHLVSHYHHESNDYLQQIKIYFQVISRVQDIIIDRIIKVISEIIAERGSQINAKIGKSKEHITEMLNFMKSIRKIFEVVEMKTFKIQMAMEKCFKKLLDGIEVSKNLAEFTDFTIRQCSRLKLDDETCELKFKDILLVLTSLSAKDSYLLHHQQLLSKRMIDSLNEPKIQIQQIFLKLIAEYLGTIMVATHFGMIKDIETSNQFTQKCSQKIPFISYKWNLKIINPTNWPDSCIKTKFKSIQAPLYLQMHLNQLQEFYHNQYDYRYLKWRLERGTSLFDGKLNKGKYRFQAENIYMMILLHISEQPNYTILFGNLKKMVNDDKQEGQKATPLQNYLRVLVQTQLVMRHQTLKNEPFTAGQELTINLNYSPAEQLKPNQPVLIKPTSETMKIFHQSSVEQSKIMKEREKLIEAVLVKLLKHSHSANNNNITFAQLYKGIKEHSFLGALNFSQAIVKQRLQELISKQYCMRDEQDRRIYHYIA